MIRTGVETDLTATDKKTYIKNVAAAEQREAAFGGAAVVKPEHTIGLIHRGG